VANNVKPTSVPYQSKTATYDCSTIGTEEFQAVSTISFFFFCTFPWQYRKFNFGGVNMINLKNQVMKEAVTCSVASQGF
jgi:hypothetical protein